MGNRPADVACLHPIKAITHRPRQSLARPTPLPLPPSQQLRVACDATCFSAYMRQPRPFRNNFLLHSSLIRVLGAEQSAPKDRRRFPDYTGPRIFGQDANILAGRAGITAGTVRQRRRPYKLGGLGADPT